MHVVRWFALTGDDVMEIELLVSSVIVLNCFPIGTSKFKIRCHDASISNLPYFICLTSFIFLEVDRSPSDALLPWIEKYMSWRDIWRTYMRTWTSIQWRKFLYILVHLRWHLLQTNCSKNSQNFLNSLRKPHSKFPWNFLFLLGFLFQHFTTRSFNRMMTNFLAGNSRLKFESSSRSNYVINNGLSRKKTISSTHLLFGSSINNLKVTCDGLSCLL